MKIPLFNTEPCSLEQRYHQPSGSSLEGRFQHLLFRFFSAYSFSRKEADFLRFLLFFSVLALIFVNGWTDAPNAIAGVVATGSMPYRAAAWMAAACNLAGALFFCLMGGQVAKTILNLTDFSLYRSNAPEKVVRIISSCSLVSSRHRAMRRSPSTSSIS